MRSGIHNNVGVFSERVREYLRTSGYSQKELADKLNLHAKVLSRKLNSSGNAYLTHQDIRRIIIVFAYWHVITSQDEVVHLLKLAQMEPTIFSADEWHTPPLSMLTVRRTRPLSVQDSNVPVHNLSVPTTRLIGREWAVDRLGQLLSQEDVRLVTLVGPGGSGKTRLAMHVAGEQVEKFTQGVWFISLAALSDPAQVPLSIMQALNVKSTPNLVPIESLNTYLKSRQLLLVLDNFEQLSEAVGFVDGMLAAVPGLKVLVTSRAVLHMYGEHEFSVPPLDVPDPNLPLETKLLLHYGAVQLFVERARAVIPDFALTDENAAVIVQICARVDGLPLALELAAARIKVLPPALLLERLTYARLQVLTGGARNLPGRQQTLRKTISWSYDLLSLSEQAWFRRFGVFAGSWSLEAAETLVQGIVSEEDATASLSPLDMLEQLVDNSLLTCLPALAGRQTRFVMLEILREFALERLNEQGELELLRDWHACYYLREVEAGEVGLRGRQQLPWLMRQKADLDNIRAAMQWSLQRARADTRVSTFPRFTHGAFQWNRTIAGSSVLSARGADTGMQAVELCLRLATASRPYWEWQGYLDEARNWLTVALELPIEDDAEETVLAARAKAWNEAAKLTCLQNDQARTIELAEKSITLCKQLNDPVGVATALMYRGWAAHALGEYETATAKYQEGMQYLASTDEVWLQGQLYMYLAGAAGFSFEFEQMRAFYAKSRELSEQAGDKSAVADALKDQGGITLMEGKYAEGIDYLLKSISLCCELEHKQFITTGLGMLSFAFGMRELPDPVTASLYAAQMRGASDGLMETIGLNPWTRTHPVIQVINQQIRARVDEESWQAAWAAGRELTMEQAIDLAHQLAFDV